MRLVCVGDVGVDRYMPENRLLPGGITANFTRQARRCFDEKDQIDLVSVIGTDKQELGVALSAVNIAGINCHIQVIDGTTPVQYIKIGEDGEKDFFKYDRGVLDQFKLDDNQKAIIEKADLVMTPVYWQIKNVFTAVMALDISATLAVDFSDFSTDPDFALLNSHIDKIDIAFFGLSSDQKDLIDQLEQIAVKHDKLFIITLGASGSIAFKGKNRYHCDAAPVKKVVDTTGAGDAFAAGFLSLYHCDTIDKCLNAGAQNAARTIEVVGSVPQE